MGTKNNPGEYDCYAAAAPDEPLFILRANDPLAPHLVRLWAAARCAEPYEMRRAGVELTIVASRRREFEPSKIAEAEACANAMIVWRLENSK